MSLANCLREASEVVAQFGITLADRPARRARFVNDDVFQHPDVGQYLRPQFSPKIIHDGNGHGAGVDEFQNILAGDER